MSLFLNNCIWTATSTGLGDFVVSAAAQNGYTPANCLVPGVVTGGGYHYFAVNSTQHEEGDGVWTTSTSTLTRATIRNSSTGSKVSFSSPPIVFMGGPTSNDIAVGQFPGTPTNNNASAGNVGEFVSSSVVIGSAVVLTTVTPANLTSISLTAGDWDVFVVAYISFGAGTTVTFAEISLSSTTATRNNTVGFYFQLGYPTATVIGTNATPSMFVRNRFSLSTTTTIFAVADASFATSTCSVFGFLGARRVR